MPADLELVDQTFGEELKLTLKGALVCWGLAVVARVIYVSVGGFTQGDSPIIPGVISDALMVLFAGLGLCFGVAGLVDWLADWVSAKRRHVTFVKEKEELPRG